MMRLILSFAAFVALSFAPQTSWATKKSGTLTAISDGDTVHFQSSGEKRLKVRLVGIDTPELHLQVGGGMVDQGPLAEEATKALAKLVPINSRVELESSALDNYGRTLGRLYVGNVDVNLEMVKKGMAYSYIICGGDDCDASFFSRHNVKEYLAACKVAATAQIGIFHPKTGLAQLPFEFRLEKQNRRPDKWVGDVNTHTFVQPDRYREVEPCNRVFFTSEESAVKQGFVAH
jgi:endonuclease YncB( thermonuclease family)